MYKVNKTVTKTRMVAIGVIALLLCSFSIAAAQATPGLTVASPRRAPPSMGPA